MVVIVLLVVYWTDIWNSKWRYSIAYHVREDKIVLQDKPHDCDFLRAPLGYKGCHYKKLIATVEWSKSPQGKHVASYDGGKTWVAFTPDPGVTVPQYATVQSVTITWDRVTED